MYHVDGGSGVQITKSKPTPTTERNKRPNPWAWWRRLTGNISTTLRSWARLSYNQQFFVAHHARDRKTGDEDDLIHQIKSAFRPVLRRTAAGSLRHAVRDGVRPASAQPGKRRRPLVKYPVTRDDQESLFTRDVFPGYASCPVEEIVYNQDGKIKRSISPRERKK